MKGVKESLLAEEIDNTVVESYLQESNEVIYTTLSERSIINQINEMKRNIEYIF